MEMALKMDPIADYWLKLNADETEFQEKQRCHHGVSFLIVALL